MARLLALVLMSSLVSACSGVECGEGTFASGNDCIGYDPNDKTAPVTTISPAGGRTRDPLPETVALTTDEPATIYVTTDGSDPDPATTPGETSPVTLVDITQGLVVKWTAVDAAGNVAEIQTTTFESDTTPPAPVTGFGISLSGTTANVAWNNPTDADYAGTAVARIVDVVDASPIPGMQIAPGMLSSSVTVVAAGTATSVSDPGRQPGPIRYVAWTYDDLGNYSAPVVTTALLPIGSLNAQLTYNTGNMTLAIPSAPENISLTGTTATYNGSTLTLSLAITNNTAKYFHNLKAEITSTTNASFSNADGTADGFAFKSFGPNAVAPGATVMRTLTFGVTAGQIATIDVRLADHASMFASNDRRTQQLTVIDHGTGVLQPVLSSTIRGPNDRANGQARMPVLTGGRYLDVPITHAAIERFDLVTGLRTAFAGFGIGERVNVQNLISTGAELVAVIKRGGKRKSGTFELVRLDEALRIVKSVPIGISDDRGFAFVAVSPDGRTLALPALGAIRLFDLATLEQIDANPATPAVDSILAGAPDRTRGLVFFNNGNGLIVLPKTGGLISILEKTAAGWTATTYQDASTGKGYAIATAPNGKIWIAMQTGVREFDPATKQFTNIAYPHPPYGLNVIEGQMWITRQDRLAIDHVSATGTVQRTITLPSTARAIGHWLVSAR